MQTRPAVEAASGCTLPSGYAGSDLVNWSSRPFETANKQQLMVCNVWHHHLHASALSTAAHVNSFLTHQTLLPNQGSMDQCPPIVLWPHKVPPNLPTCLHITVCCPALPARVSHHCCRAPDTPKTYLRMAQARIGLGPGEYDAATNLLHAAQDKAREQGASTRGGSQGNSGWLGMGGRAQGRVMRT